jgi:hypothetical protein
VRQGVSNYNATSPAVIDKAADYGVWYYKQPRWTIQISVTNTDDIFNYLRPGNVLSLRIWSAGFDNSEKLVKILGMSFNPEIGSVDLVLDEVIPNEPA